MINDSAFLDASGWIALLNVDDENHAAAVRAWRNLVRRRSLIVVTDWIIAETGNGLSRGHSRNAFVQAIRSIVTSGNFRVIYIDEDLLNQAIELYSARPDKSWGLVDCASFVVMTREGIRDALTRDRHFDQAGFRRLLADDDGPGDSSNGKPG